jgi:hypothetical protein
MAATTGIVAAAALSWAALAFVTTAPPIVRWIWQCVLAIPFRRDGGVATTHAGVSAVGGERANGRC